MDPEGEGEIDANSATHDSGSNPCRKPPFDHGAQPSAMETDDAVSRQSTEDVPREAKKARVQEAQPTILLHPPIVLRKEPYWMRPEWKNFLKSEKGKVKAERARIARENFKETIRRMRLNARIKRGETVPSDEDNEAMHPSNAVRPPILLAFKPSYPIPEGYMLYDDYYYGKERATQNLENVGDLSESPLQEDPAKLPEGLPSSSNPPTEHCMSDEFIEPSALQKEQAKLPEGVPSSSNPPTEYCMSDEFIEHLAKKAEAYFKGRKELSDEEIVGNGHQHMTEEAFLAFRNYTAENDLVEGFDYEFGEVLHHCTFVEEQWKLYRHFNFTVKMKKNDEDSWTSELYFAETKQDCGVKNYFCSRLLPTDAGHCYLCTNQHVMELKHPSGGGYEKGHKESGSYFPMWC